MGGGGSDVEYTQSPEQRAVYQALQPMVQRLGQQYAPTTTGGMPTTTSVPIMQLPTQSQIKNLAQEGMIGGYPIIKSSTPGRYDFMLNLRDLPKSIKREYRGDPYSKYTQWGGSLPASMFQPEHLQQYFPQIYSALYPTTAVASTASMPAQTVGQPIYSQQATTTQPTIAGQPAIGGGLYNIPYPPQIPSPQIASPLAGYQMVAPQVQAGLWQPYQEAEKRLLDVMQSRGQLGAPGAGISGAAGSALSDFYSQAARDIGLSTYQMSLPFTQMAQAPLSQHWAAQTGQLGDVWSAQLAREMMPWQMLPGLLGGTYSTGIAQETGSPLGALGAGLTTGGLGYLAAAGTAATAPYALPIALAMGAGGMMGGK